MGENTVDEGVGNQIKGFPKVQKEEVGHMTFDLSPVELSVKDENIIDDFAAGEVGALGREEELVKAWGKGYFDCVADDTVVSVWDVNRSGV